MKCTAFCGKRNRGYAVYLKNAIHCRVAVHAYIYIYIYIYKSLYRRFCYMASPLSTQVSTWLIAKSKIIWNERHFMENKREIMHDALKTQFIYLLPVYI